MTTNNLILNFSPYGKKYRRTVIVTIDTLMDLFKDYCGGDIPPDARPITIKMNRDKPGKLAIEMESESFPDSTPIDVHFEMRRIMPIGGPSEK